MSDDDAETVEVSKDALNEVLAYVALEARTGTNGCPTSADEAAQQLEEEIELGEN